MWWAIWSTLVVGTLVGAFFLGRSLWRKGTALIRAAGDSAEAVGDASHRIADAVEHAAANPPETGPTLFDDPTTLHERVAVQRRARAARATTRRQRWHATSQGWSLEDWLTSRKTARGDQ
jgi:hypothetical protein